MWLLDTKMVQVEVELQTRWAQRRYYLPQATNQELLKGVLVTEACFQYP